MLSEMSRFWNALTRRKTDDVHEGESQLARVLNLFDLTALGVGSTLGLGVYVLAGQVAYNIAGPAVTISFLIAALASAFAGICYAEFAARVPKAGSAYVYSYVTIGEFVAFTIGWNLILEYVIGTASVARGLSGYFDSLIDNNMSKALNESMHIDVSFLGDYPDFLSFGMVLLLAGLLAFGAKESSFLNNIFTSINLVTIGIVLVAGGMNGESSFSLSLLFNINAFSSSLSDSQRGQLAYSSCQCTRLGWHWWLHALRYCWRHGRCGQVLLWLCRIRLHCHNRRGGHQSET